MANLWLKAVVDQYDLDVRGQSSRLRRRSSSEDKSVDDDCDDSIVNQENFGNAETAILTRELSRFTRSFTMLI